MEEQANETFSERTVSDGDEELNHEYAEFNEDWEDVIAINPDDSASQISRLDSEALSTTGSSVWAYFDKNPPGAQGFNVCKKCSTRYKLSTSVTILRNHLKKHQLKVPTKKLKSIVKKKDPFDKEEQKKHDNYLVQ